MTLTKLHFVIAKENQGYDVNCENQNGYTALSIAVKNEDERMVELLLSIENVEVRDSHLLAIEVSNINVLVRLLDKLRSIGPEFEFGPCSEIASEFSPDITPLILAAHNNNFEIVNLLLRRGHLIEPPHLPYCQCADHKNQGVYAEKLETCRKRLNTYKALVSPAYICQVTEDPILEAFNLYNQLASFVEIQEFKSEYLELEELLMQFSTQLISLCHTLEEVETVLKEKCGFINTGAKIQYPRLALAIEGKQKQFVAHPNVQQVLRREWLGEWHGLDRFPAVAKVVIFLSFTWLIPIAVLIHFAGARTRLGKLWRAPVVRFVGFLTSYLGFLATVIFHTVCYQASVRGPPHIVLVLTVIVWTSSFLLRDFMKLIIRGQKYFYSTKWNMFDACMESVFLIVTGLWIASYIDVKDDDNEYAERIEWKPTDLTLISEGVFSIASILAVLRLFCVLQLNSTLGPLQIAVQKMVKEIVRFAGIFLIIVISFSSAFCHMYWYYADMKSIDSYGNEVYSGNAFTDFKSAMKTLFWTLFGVISFEVADIVVSSDNETNSTDDITSKHPPQNHWFTEEVGYLLFGVYHVIAILLFMNILVAAMSSRMDEVLENSEIEWKFSRTVLWLDYFDDSSILPVPLNLLGIPWIIVKLVEQQRSRLQKNSKKSTWKAFFQYELYQEASQEYMLLLKRLIRRYLRYSASNKIFRRHQ